MNYRGEIFVIFRKLVPNAEVPKVGDVIDKMKVPQHRQMLLHTVRTLEQLGIAERGDGGFGMVWREETFLIFFKSTQLYD